jgi:hypothetical protein
MRTIHCLLPVLFLCVQTRAQSVLPALDSAYQGTLTFRMDRHGDLLVEQTDALGRLSRTTLPVRWMRTGDLAVEVRTEGLQLTCSTQAGRCLEREHFAQGATVRSSRVLFPWTTGEVDQERTMALWVAMFDEMRNGADLVGLKP